MIEYGINKTGENVIMFDPITIGFPSRDNIGKTAFTGVSIGNDAIIRSGAIIYCDVKAGNSFSTGHNVIVREKTVMGDNVSFGTGVIIEGNCEIGNHVFVGPYAVLTNDKYPPHSGQNLKEPTISDHVSIGANVTILPGVFIGEGY